LLGGGGREYRPGKKEGLRAPPLWEEGAPEGALQEQPSGGKKKWWVDGEKKKNNRWGTGGADRSWWGKRQMEDRNRSVVRGKTNASKLAT